MENSIATCKLKVPKDLSGKVPAILVNFPNGCVNFNNSEKLDFKCYRHETHKGTANSDSKRILRVTSDRLNFKSVAPTDNYCRNRLRYFVGVRKKNSGKMKVYESISFHLKPIRDNSNTPSTSKAKNYIEKLDDLTMNFGSKGKKRSMVARQRYSTDTTVLGDALKDMALDDSQNHTNYPSPLNKTATNIEYIPPQNDKAKFVDEVYNISDIISAEVDEYLAERANELLQDAPTRISRWKTDATFCEYVLKHMEKDLDSLQMKYLLYYNYLVKFSCLLSSDIRKKDPAPEIPERVKQNLLESFTASSSTENGKVTRTFPLKMKDKLLAYIIVLALFIDNYFVNLGLLQKGMKYGLPKVSNIAQAVGCYISRRKIENASIPFAELKLPLNSLRKYYKKI